MSLASRSIFCWFDASWEINPLLAILKIRLDSCGACRHAIGLYCGHFQVTSSWVSQYGCGNLSFLLNSSYWWQRRNSQFHTLVQSELLVFMIYQGCVRWRSVSGRPAKTKGLQWNLYYWWLSFLLVSCEALGIKLLRAWVFLLVRLLMAGSMFQLKLICLQLLFYCNYAISSCILVFFHRCPSRDPLLRFFGMRMTCFRFNTCCIILPECSKVIFLCNFYRNYVTRYEQADIMTTGNLLLNLQILI